MLYIGASPGGLPAGEASPSRHADCGTGTTGARRILRKLTVSYGPTEMLYIGPIIGAPPEYLLQIQRYSRLVHCSQILKLVFMLF